MTKRQPPTKEVEAAVLTQSGRRCAFCFGLSGDLIIKQGQIAHIDHDSSNSAEDNLAFLCLPHHDQYDGRTSQSKGLAESELRIYKRLLLQAIERREHQINVGGATASPISKVLAHDVEIFKASDALLKERELEYFLELLGSDHSYRSEPRLRITGLALYFSETGNQYLLRELAESNSRFIEQLNSLGEFLAVHFFYYPNHQARENPQFCMYPDFNVDRGGDGTPEEGVIYNKRTRELNDLVESTADSYKEYRLLIKQHLFI